MEELSKLIERFQSLKSVTGTSKSSSYSVTIVFEPWDDKVQVEFGGYDISGWSRHEHLQTTVDNLLIDVEVKIAEAERIVEEEGDTLSEDDLDVIRKASPVSDLNESRRTKGIF